MTPWKTAQQLAATIQNLYTKQRKRQAIKQLCASLREAMK